MAGSVVSGLTRAFSRFQESRNRSRTHTMDKYAAEEGDGQGQEGDEGMEAYGS